IGVSAEAIHLERRRSESAHDELAVAIGRTVKGGLIRSSHVIAANEYSVGMRMRVEVHVFGLVKCGLHGVVPGRVCAVHPIVHRGTRGGVKSVPFLRKPRIGDAHPCLFFRGIDLAAPAWDADAAVSDGARAIRGAAPGKAGKRTLYVEQYDAHRHNRQQGTEDDNRDLFYHLWLA